MGLRIDLNLQGNDFSNIATFLFVALLCFEIPNSTSSPFSPPAQARQYHMLVFMTRVTEERNKPLMLNSLLPPKVPGRQVARR